MRGVSAAPTPFPGAPTPVATLTTPTPHTTTPGPARKNDMVGVIALVVLVLLGIAAVAVSFARM